jgi:homoaconitase/3-isopropylmalate dehydratase large subunit
LHSNAEVSLRNEIECVKSVGKMNHTFGVKLSHPYIGVCVNNRLRDMQRLIRRPLEVTCMVSDAREAYSNRVGCIVASVFLWAMHLGLMDV